MGDCALHDRQQHAQRGGSPRGWFCRPLCVGPVDARQARAAASIRTELISDARDPGPAGAQRCRAAASVGYSGPIGLDRRAHEARSVALRGILVGRGELRVCARYLGREATPVARQPRSGISRARADAWPTVAVRPCFSRQSARLSSVPTLAASRSLVANASQASGIWPALSRSRPSWKAFSDSGLAAADRAPSPRAMYGGPQAQAGKGRSDVECRWLRRR